MYSFKCNLIEYTGGKVVKPDSATHTHKKQKLYKKTLFEWYPEFLKFKATCNFEFSFRETTLFVSATYDTIMPFAFQDIITVLTSLNSNWNLQNQTVNFKVNGLYVRWNS